MGGNAKNAWELNHVIKSDSENQNLKCPTSLVRTNQDSRSNFRHHTVALLVCLYICCGRSLKPDLLASHFDSTRGIFGRPSIAAMNCGIPT